MRAIIPCCGFGTRVEMQPNQSKEMLKDHDYTFEINKWPNNSTVPLIKWPIDQCENNNIDPLILVRKEKIDLIDWCKENKVEYKIMEPGKEWAETVYNSNPYWDEKNVLILPDTRWHPYTILIDMKMSFDFGSELIFAVRKVEDPQNWGIVTSNCFVEKPSSKGEMYAWGLIGFTKESGLDIFKTMQIKNKWSGFKYNTNFLFLNEFKDLTRK